MSNPCNNREENAKLAKEHFKFIEKTYKDSTKYSVLNSKFYFEDFHLTDFEPLVNKPSIRMIEADTITCTELMREYLAGKGNKHDKICILNFASFKNPGGKFLEGSMAQEEAICHKTNLYNILSSDEIVDKFYKPNRKSLNKALYKNRAIYTPDVIVLNDTHLSHVKHLTTVDVLTCAAPNYSAAHRFNDITRDACNNVMKERIEFILNVMDDNKVDIAILGAFGCGVFKNDPTFVAESFKELIQSRNHTMTACIFAVPKGKNYKEFAEVLTDGTRSVFPHGLKR